MSDPWGEVAYFKVGQKLTKVIERAREHFFAGLEHAVHEKWLDAEREFRASLELAPGRLSTLSNLCATLIKLKRFREAVELLDHSLSINPDSPELTLNRGIVLLEEGQFAQALACFDRSIALRADYPDAWLNRGATLNFLGRHFEARSAYEMSVELHPNSDLVLGELVHTQMKLGDWTCLAERLEVLRTRLWSQEMACTPFVALGLFDDPALLRQAAANYSRSKLPSNSPLGDIPRRPKRDRIRIGYFSMDFREHPVAHLMAELIEFHDRRGFEVYGFSFGVGADDPMRRRLESAFDKFFDVRDIGELEIARLAREQEIDIAIDLGGYTQDARPQIFAHRAAPIQINYLGFPGTMGSTCMDYFIGDRVVITDENRQHFSEKIIYMPNSYQVNDSKRMASHRVFSRQEVGLPETGFVFCCFNNLWKILPETFDRWMRILHAVDNSILWLYEGNPVATENVRKAAEHRNINPDRLVFAGHMPHPEHLARYKCADLFLDTLPYNAHTTASDALWMGVPVLTQPGESFASRVASSLLHAVGLPELIAQSPQEYEAIAIDLATNPSKLTPLKSHLTDSQSKKPLFYTRQYTQHLEAAYKIIYERCVLGLGPMHIDVNKFVGRSYSLPSPSMEYHRDTKLAV